MAIVAGEFTGSAVRVRGSDSIDILHAWQNGAFGELIACATASATHSSSHHLMLSMVEAYFLAFELQRITLHYLVPEVSCKHLVPEVSCNDGTGQATTLSSDGDINGSSDSATPASSQTGLLAPECWLLFCAAGKNFPHRYAVYRSLRNEGWIIRTGLKFGCDYTLYAQADAPGGHARLSALVASSNAPPQHSWSWLQQHVRLCHGVAKGSKAACGHA